MKQRAFTIRVREFDSREQLLPEQDRLVGIALEAAKNAYAPYSSYHVGAAVRLDEGEILSGSNQENAAYPSGLCAERTVLFYAGANHPGQAVEAMAIVAIQDGKVQEEPVAPCGGCRQVLLESERRGGRDMEIILYGSKRIHILKRATDLLPLPFHFDKQDPST